MNTHAVAAACLTTALIVLADEPSGALFPFVLPWDDASPGVTDLSGWLPKPAGKFGQVHADEDGHLYAGGTRIRFFGVDLSFSANVPKHADAEKVAARLAKFGVNIVRFHIMDMRRFPEGILARNASDTSTLDPEALDRLDYFIDQLNSRGVYANLCLLNYRPLCAADGLPPEIEQAGGGPYQRRHVVGFFNEAVLGTQRVYARNLLAHRNAYTHKTHAESPGVAFVEINNENGLIHAWLDGGVDALPECFRSELRTQWNAWLRTRYGTDARVRQAWSAGESTPGPELLTNGDFAQGTQGWVLECHRPDAEASLAESASGPDALPGTKAVEVRVAKPGAQSWFIRFEQSGVRVRADAAYTLAFWARADRPTVLNASLEMSHEPWHVLAARRGVALTTQWQRFRFVLPVSEGDERVRMIFDPPPQAGTLALAGVSLREGGVCGLSAGERLTGDAVPLFGVARFSERTEAAQRDWIRFLWETEERYWQTMRDYLKRDLGVSALVIGTMTGCSTPNLMAEMDAVDSHAYWQHPVFPGRPWDMDNW